MVFRKRKFTKRKGAIYVNKRKRKFRMGRTRASRSKASVSVQKSLLFADRQFVKLRYEQELPWTGGLLVTSFANTIRGNGPNDPDFALGGQQPVAYDQWAAFYGFYRCYGSKINCSFIPSNAPATGVTTPQPINIVVYPLDSSTGATTTRLAGQYPDAMRKTIFPSNPRICRTKQYMSTAKISGVPKGRVKFDDIFACATNTTPSIQWYWQIIGDDALGGALSTDGVIRCQITYYMEFFGRINLGQS